MSGLGLRVQLNATLTAWNEDEIEPMCALAERLGLLLRWNTQISPRDDGDRAPLALAPSPAPSGASRRCSTRGNSRRRTLPTRGRQSRGASTVAPRRRG